MSDIVERLRARSAKAPEDLWSDESDDELHDCAADEIERLRALIGESRPSRLIVSDTEEPKWPHGLQICIPLRNATISKGIARAISVADERVSAEQDVLRSMTIAHYAYSELCRVARLIENWCDVCDEANATGIYTRDHENARIALRKAVGR